MISQKPLAFIAVNIPDHPLESMEDSCGEKDPQVIGVKLLTLTSRIMEWSRKCWILDLSPCHRYWSHQAQRSEVSLEELIKRKLEDVLGEGTSAAWTDHPWRSVLLATYMKHRGLRGLMVIEDGWSLSLRDSGLLQTTEKLVRDLSWDSWWSSWEILSTHFHRLKKSQLSILRREGLAMQKAAARLGCQSPREWALMGPSSLARRFGKTISQVWSWTYHRPKQVLWQTADFPWFSFQGRDSPQVVRHLEFPLQEWAHLEPWLREDFDRLCRHPALRENEGVLLIHWTLFLDDLGEKLVPLVFRYPHRFQTEQGHHRTGCLQALYSFEQHFKGERDPLLPPCVIIGWCLSIEESLIQSEQKVDLFGEKSVLTTTDESISDLKMVEIGRCRDLVEMENRLPVPLYGYRLHGDWTPEDSFVDDRGKFTGLNVEEQRASLQALAQKRPLFIYQKPMAYRPPRSAHFSFIERTMVKWWHDSDLSIDRENSQETGVQTCLGVIEFKDYYLVRESSGIQNRWVYKDSKTNKWFVQGLYA